MAAHPKARAPRAQSRFVTTACNAAALRKASRRVSQLYDAALAPLGLRATQLSILMHVSQATAPTVSDLAASLVLDRTALAHNLKPLERDRLVTITVSPDDRRSRLVMLTGRGAEALERGIPLWREAQARFEGAFGADQAALLRKLLGDIAAPGFLATFGADADASD